MSKTDNRSQEKKIPCASWGFEQARKAEKDHNGRQAKTPILSQCLMRHSL